MRSRAVNLPALCSRSRRSAPPPASASASKRCSSSVRSLAFEPSAIFGVGIRLRLVSDTGSSCRRGFGKHFGGCQGRRLFRTKYTHCEVRGKPSYAQEEDDAKKQLCGHGGSAVQGRFERSHFGRRPNQDEHGGKSHGHNENGRNNRSKDLLHRMGCNPRVDNHRIAQTKRSRQLSVPLCCQVGWDLSPAKKCPQLDRPERKLRNSPKYPGLASLSSYVCACSPLRTTQGLAVLQEAPMLARTLRSDSSFPTRRNLRKIQVLCSILAILLLAAPSGAQQQGQSQGQQGPPRPGTPPAEPAPPQNPGPVTLPAGTQLVLILTHPIDSKAMHRGSIVFAETTAPVLLDDQMIIPAGAFVQGNVEKVARQGSRAELAMQSVSVALSDGSVINMQGPLEIISGEGTAWRNPGNAAKAGALLGPFVGLGLGSAIGA